MYFSTQLIAYVRDEGDLLITRIVPKKSINKVIVDRIRDIDLDINQKNTYDIGTFRVYNIKDFEIIETCTRLKKFIKQENTLEFEIEHLGIPIGSSYKGNAGMYNLVLPSGWVIEELTLVTLEKNFEDIIEINSKLDQKICWDIDLKANILELLLSEKSETCSFKIIGKCSKLNFKNSPLKNNAKGWSLLEDSTIKLEVCNSQTTSKIRNLLNHFGASIILEPNINGIGIDFKKLLSKK